MILKVSFILFNDYEAREKFGHYIDIAGMSLFHFSLIHPSWQYENSHNVYYHTEKLITLAYETLLTTVTDLVSYFILPLEAACGILSLSLKDLAVASLVFMQKSW